MSEERKSWPRHCSCGHAVRVHFGALLRCEAPGCECLTFELCACKAVEPEGHASAHDQEARQRTKDRLHDALVALLKAPPASDGRLQAIELWAEPTDRAPDRRAWDLWWRSPLDAESDGEEEKRVRYACTVSPPGQDRRPVLQAFSAYCFNAFPDLPALPPIELRVSPLLDRGVS